MSGGYTYKSAAELRSKGPRDAAMEVRRFGSFATPEVADRALAIYRSFTPIGGRLSKPTKAHPAGLAIRSWHKFAIPSAEGRAFGIGNRAPYAGILNQGRRRNKSAYRVRIKPGKVIKKGGVFEMPPGSRMLGSKQAPKGILRPAYKRLKMFEQEVTRIAVAKYGARG